MTVQQQVVPPPLLGLNKRAAYSMLDEAYTADSLNVWPYDWVDTGRQRIGTRPGLNSIGSPGVGVPYNWCEATYVTGGGVEKVGVALAGQSGVAFSTDGATWNTLISASAPSNFASCAVYLNKLFFARGESTVRVYDLYSSATVGDLGAAAEADEFEGDAPTNCGLVVAWGDRLVLAGDTENPHQLYMARIGEPYDYDYSAIDPSAAISISGSGGIIGEPITSLIPHNQQCLLVGCTDSIYVIRGNPKRGGTIEKLSHSVGPLMQSAWCKDGEDWTWMLTRDGLYKMAPGCGAPPQRVSRQVLPEALVGLDAGDTSGYNTKVSLCYDNRYHGIHIVVDPGGEQIDNYFYDLGNGGFWVQNPSFIAHLGLTIKSASSSTKSGAMLIDESGTNIYQFDESQDPPDSRLYYGPIALGSPHNHGILTSVDAVLGNDSGDVAWSVYAGDSPEEAYNLASASYTGTNWSKSGTRYSQYREHPRVRGTVAFIRVDDVGANQWTIEEIAIETAQVGRKRV